AEKADDDPSHKRSSSPSKRQCIRAGDRFAADCCFGSHLNSRHRTLQSWDLMTEVGRKLSHTFNQDTSITTYGNKFESLPEIVRRLARVSSKDTGSFPVCPDSCARISDYRLDFRILPISKMSAVRCKIARSNEDSVNPINRRYGFDLAD